MQELKVPLVRVVDVAHATYRNDGHLGEHI
jgi:hypothetical protein